MLGISEEDVYEGRWRYLAEGALNVVFRYQATTNHPAFTGKVLRVSKLKFQDSGRMMDHMRQLFGSFLGNHLIPSSIPVALSGSVAAQLMHFILPCRKEKRRKEFDGDEFKALKQVEACLMPNLTLDSQSNPAFTLEIKPKWGFMPSFDSVHPVKKRFCRYCMHQRLKLEEGSIESIGGYCPLDLFSEDPERIQQALEELTLNPQNNLRLFVGGIEKDPASLMEIEEKLLGLRTRRQVLDLLLQVIIEITPLLRQIKAIQMLDEIDIQNLFPLWNRLEPDEKEKIDAAVLSQSWKSQFLEYARDSLKREVLREKPGNESGIESKSLDLSEVVLSLCAKFLVSVSAKDLSLMITIWPALDEDKIDSNLIHISMNGIQFSVRVAVVDIDFKSSSKMKKWFETDQEIMKTFCKDMDIHE